MQSWVGLVFVSLCVVRFHCQSVSGLCWQYLLLPQSKSVIRPKSQIGLTFISSGWVRQLA